MWDFFGFRKFEAETVVERHQIEPSRLFDERAIENMGDLSVELFDRLNLVPKISSYFRMGDLAKTIDLINRSIITGKHTQNSRVIEVTAEFRVYDIAENFIKFLTDQNLNNSSIRKKIFSMHRKWGPNLEGIFLKLLDDPDSIIRQEAIGNLVYFLHSDTERAMISCLYDQDALVRRYATFWLGNKKLKRAVANLKLSLFDEDYYVRCLSIWALCRIKDYQAVPSLLLCLWDRNEAVRTQLVNDLPTFGSEVLGPALISSLNYDSYDVKETAIKIMGALKSKEFVPGVAGCLMDPRLGIRSAALDALGKIKHKSAVPYLIKYQWEKAPHLRRPILRILGEIGDPSAIPILVSCLGEDDKYLREEAVEVLAKFGDKRALIPLLDVFSDSGLDISHRDYIYWKYSKLEPLLAILKKNPNEISELLKDSNVLIRNIALEAIGLLGKKSYIPVLAHHLLDDNPEVRRIAVESLGKFEANSSVISILEKSLLDDNPEVRRTVVESLSKFEASSSVVSILEKSVLDEKPEVRKAALEALDNFGSISSTQLFIQSLTDKDIGVSVSSINVLKRLLESNKLKPSEKLKLVLEDLLKIGKNEQRIAAISCLGKFRDKAVAPILLGYLQDTLLRSSVIEALGELGDVRAIPQLVGLLNSPLLDIRRGAIEALGKIGCVSVFPELIRIISLRQGLDGEIAAGTLGEFGCSLAIPILKEALEAYIPSIRLSNREMIEISTSSTIFDSETTSSKESNLKQIQIDDCSPFVKALGELGNPTIIPLVKELDRSKRIKDGFGWKSAYYLALAHTECIHSLDLILNSIPSTKDDMEAQLYAVLAFISATRDREEAIPLLIREFSELNELAHFAALVYLSTFDNDLIEAYVQKECSGSNDNARILSMLSKLKESEERGMDEFIEFYQNLDKSYRIFIPLFWTINEDFECEELMVRLLEVEKNPEVQLSLLRCLGLRVDPGKISDEKFLADFLISSNRAIRSSAEVVLASMGTLSGINLLRSRIIDESELLPARKKAVESLVQAAYKNNPRALDLILELLRGDDENILCKVCIELSGFEEPWTLPHDFLRSATHLMKQKILNLEKRKEQWREIRDKSPSEIDETERNQKLDQLKPKEYLEHQLAYTITYLSPEDEGMALLDHCLSNVRMGAALGFGKFKKVSLLETLYRKFQQGGSPLFHHAVYRAMDNMLLRIEFSGLDDDLEKLKEFQKKHIDKEGKGGSQSGFKARLHWTVDNLERNLNYLHRLEKEAKEKLESQLNKK